MLQKPRKPKPMLPLTPYLPLTTMLQLKPRLPKTLTIYLPLTAMVQLKPRLTTYLTLTAMVLLTTYLTLTAMVLKSSRLHAYNTKSISCLPLGTNLPITLTQMETCVLNPLTEESWGLWLQRTSKLFGKSLRSID